MANYDTNIWMDFREFSLWNIEVNDLFTANIDSLRRLM